MNAAIGSLERQGSHRSGRHRRAAIINGVMAVVAAGAVMAAASLSALSSKGRQPAGPPPMTLSELEVSLRRNQITPESLAALGLSGTQVETLLTQAHAALSSSVVNLRTAQSEFGEARAQEQILERKVRAGIDRAESARQLAAARTALASKTEALNLQLAAVKTAAAAQILGDAQASTLAAIAGNSGWSMPVEYRCRTGVSEAEWVQLREALADQRIAQRENREITLQSQQVLNTWHASAAVSAARTNLAARLPEVQSVWTSFFD